ncbi:MAG: tetratricopeptide repeat protein [Sphingobacteriales bacterium]|uniref:tetratricopeptide repeat protein n=1 Tax=Hydrotalea flava TaxID=714549 RepID=UPI000F94B5A5|nr:tetratricopeptide repeat protein [Hydrotalea flava]RTL51986.1 MAG: tetratricopeptide repeat protein [Sphingobacteriales bacterium]
MPKVRIFSTAIFLLAVLFVQYAAAQDLPLLFKQATNAEINLNEQQALAIYKKILVIAPDNLNALVKATELSCSTGERLPIANDKRITFQSALAYAQRAIAAHPEAAESYYALALASAKMTEVEKDRKLLVQYVKDIKTNADKALNINPNLGMANFVEGRWHYEMNNLNWAKKLALKTMYPGGIPPTSYDSAIVYLEKCRQTQPYYVMNYLILAKSYQANNNPSKAIEVLKQLVKLPVRTPDDAALKTEGQKMLDSLE